MTALAIEKALNKQRLGPVPRPSHLRVVHDIDRPVVTAEEPRQRIRTRLSVARNKTFLFALIVVAIVSPSMVAYTAGEFDRDVRDARAQIAEIEVAPMPVPLPQIGVPDTVSGERKWPNYLEIYKNSIMDAIVGREGIE